jgi:hypothetical protein
VHEGQHVMLKKRKAGENYVKGKCMHLDLRKKSKKQGTTTQEAKAMNGRE